MLKKRLTEVFGYFRSVLTSSQFSVVLSMPTILVDEVFLLDSTTAFRYPTFF